jgi:hypothetical protein
MIDKPPLRIALLLDDLTQPVWIRTMLAEVVAAPTVELVAVIINGSPTHPRLSIRERISAYRRSLLYLAYTQFDQWRAGTRGDPFAPTEIGDLVGTAPQLVVRPRQTKYCDYFEPEDIERIRAYNLDVALRLGFRILKGDALQVARFGVWSYHHADNAWNRGGPPGFWEVAKATPVTGAVLQILSEELDNGRVIYRSYSATNPYSVAKNLRSYYWKSAAFVPRKLSELYDVGPPALTDPIANGFTAYSNRLYKQPSNSEMLRILPRVVVRYAREKIRTTGTRDQWFLAYKLRRSTSGDSDVPDRTFYNFKLIVPPIDRFWADPFPIEYAGRYYVFFEEYLYKTRRGHISVFPLTEEGGIGTAQVALQTPHHLSYPNVFAWRGEVYMLPEAADSGRVQLYRCAEFPSRWEAAGVPLEATAGADPTIAKIGDRWWLFLTLARPGTDSWDDELHLYFAETPLGPWTPHPRNPIKSDVRGARPAGRVFEYRGEFYRPAQVCAPRYGYGMTIHRITRIDERAFEEIPAATIRPEWLPGLRGTHTINAVGDLTVIDGQWRRSWLFRRRSTGHAAAIAAGDTNVTSVSYSN